jgi:Carboxypeptidase regulatory-like domain
MKNLRIILALALSVAWAAAQTQQPSLRGVVTDPSGAVVPGALVQVRGPGGEQRSSTDQSGRYVFPSLRPGKYLVRVIVKGFSVSQKQNFDITGSESLDVQLAIAAESQVVNVEDEAGKVGVDPTSNASAVVLGEKELAALSDDPDELLQQLQAMAGPSGGPNGGQIYIDGFTGGQLPSKSSIREVRINSNPMSPEYDKPGFGRVEIFTKPGTDTIRGQAFFQYNKEFLNSRSPLLQQSTRPPFQQRFYGLTLTGPIKKQKASFGLDFERRNITEDAVIIATTLDNNLNIQNINQAIVTPQVRNTVTPRLDYTINTNNTLVVRYQDTRVELDKEGVGNFGLTSQAYNQKTTENTVQVTETAVLNPKMINETRFQYLRAKLSNIGDNSIPGLNVQGAFSGGGSQIGNSGNTANRVELTNMTTLTEKAHTIKWGARFRQSFYSDTSVSNFGGTFAFFGGLGPQLDASNQPIPGTSINISALERYRRTLLFERAGLSTASIRQYGGGASQFTLNAGTPLTSVNQFDIGLFINDDWRMRPNLTLSYGLRYETQTNIGDRGDLAPRVGIAWGVDSHANKPGKTVLRAGFGTFYDRIADNVTLQSERFNGTTQQSYFIMNPDFYPTIPTLSALAGGRQPQQLQLIYAGLLAPRTYQATAGLDRQINKYARVSVTYMNNRGVHVQRSRNINAPIDGLYPSGDRAVRLLTESTGFSRSNQLIVSPSVNYKKMFLFGFYMLGNGQTDAEGQPANPYNLHAEWGPSTFGDVRQRFLIGTSIPLPWQFSISPFFFASSGTPYNITTGHDPNGTGFTTARPALVSGVGASGCNSGDLFYANGFGCFDLNPGPGVPTIGRNYGRGPDTVTLNLRVARSWAFGNRGESGVANGAGPIGLGGARGGGMPAGGMPGGGPPSGMFGAQSGKKYNLTLSISARNVLNRANFSPPSGDLSSPFFGEYRGLAGFGPFGSPTTYNRKIDLQLRLQF